ncbi:MAG: hypothetical protein AB7I30_05180 [Isosphaeraceae bacterium]
MSTWSVRPIDLVRSWPSLARLAASLSTAITIAAIFVGRFFPPSPEIRRPGSTPPIFVPRDPLWEGARSPDVFDPNTGRRLVASPPIPAGLLSANRSAWWTEERGTEWIGHLVTHSNSRHETARTRSELVLLEASGEVLRRISLTEGGPTPTGPFCWFDDATERAHFSGTDGHLYVCDFENDRGIEREYHAVPRLRRVGWETERPGGAGSILRDPYRSRDPRLFGLTFVSVRYGVKDADRSFHATHEIWWIRLNPEGDLVRDAGRLIQFREEPPDSRRVVRFPVIESDLDGDLHLASLRHESGQKGWSLQIVTVEFDAETGRPWASANGLRTLARGRLAIQPAFSSDGRRICAVSRGTDSRVRSRCYAIGNEATELAGGGGPQRCSTTRR